MTDERMTSLLAERVMGWKRAPGRFLLGGRRWMPSWRFQPLLRREDAFRLLDAAAPSERSINNIGELSVVRVVVNGRVGTASHTSEPRAITYAVAEAIGLDNHQKPKTGADCK
jgi:hypothetical protein